VIVAALIAASGGAIFFLAVRDFSGRSAVGPHDRTVAGLSPGADRRAWQPPPVEDYVGSEACAACHGEIAASYRSHPMSRSIRRVDAESNAGLPHGEESRVDGTQRILEVEMVEGTMRHHERMLDESGAAIYDQAVPMEYVVGSGRRAMAFLHRRAKLLFMSPLNWYSRSRRWDLAPGYRPDDPRRFDRRVTDECLSCHAGRVAPAGRSLNAYERPAFHELSIGCENCHGPGRRHVALCQSDPSAGREADPIVNPARLDDARRESVCNQCHLQAAARVPRYGRNDLDFRPGQEFEEIWSVLDDEESLSDDGRTRAVSHVQQMRESRCYAESGGRFGCISCHDPHRVPPETERAAFYRHRCLQCHGVGACALPAERRQEQEDSCIACHMPAREASNVAHVTQTDHRVIRRVAPASPGKPAHGPGGLVFFDRGDRRLEPWERDRALGLAAWKYLSKKGVPRPADLVAFLEDILDKVPDDGKVLTALGSIAAENQQTDQARRFYERALPIPEAEEAALSGLLDLYYYYRAAERDRALQYADRLLEIDPGDARVHAIRADLLGMMARQDEAIEAARRALEFNPTLLPVREWLAEALRKAGRGDQQREQEQIIQRMKTARARRPR
jgi:hypothetical protein